jgi:protein O-GlcNAc transferase
MYESKIIWFTSSCSHRYHCEDPNCYSDLARLRGVKYLTWRDKSKLKAQDIKQDLESSYYEKHANYVFDKEEFVNIVNEAVVHVKEQARELNYLTHDELWNMFDKIRCRPRLGNIT